MKTGGFGGSTSQGIKMLVSVFSFLNGLLNQLLTAARRKPVGQRTDTVIVAAATSNNRLLTDPQYPAVKIQVETMNAERAGITDYQRKALAIKVIRSERQLQPQAMPPAIAQASRGLSRKAVLVSCATSGQGLVVLGLRAKPRRNMPVTRLIASQIDQSLLQKPKRQAKPRSVHLGVRDTINPMKTLQELPAAANALTKGLPTSPIEIQSGLDQSDHDQCVRHLSTMAALMGSTIGNAPATIVLEATIDLELTDAA